MRGDVWVSENKNGEKVLFIDNGKFVSEKILKPVVRDNHKYIGLVKLHEKKWKKGLTCIGFMLYNRVMIMERIKEFGTMLFMFVVFYIFMVLGNI